MRKKHKVGLKTETSAKATAFVIAKRKVSTRLSAKTSLVRNASLALQELSDHIKSEGFCMDGWGIKWNTVSHPALIQEYAQLLCEHIANLNLLIENEIFLKALLPFSQSCFAWPVRVSKRKPFGEDRDKLIDKLQVGKHTIAADPNARFNPSKRFGKVAFDILQRIEWERTNNRLLFRKDNPPPMWIYDAKMLPPFNTKATLIDKKKWLAVVEQLLEEDLRNPELTKSYRLLITANSHEERWRAVLFDKLRGEFDSLWGFHRQRKK